MTGESDLFLCVCVCSVVGTRKTCVDTVRRINGYDFKLTACYNPIRWNQFGFVYNSRVRNDCDDGH